MPTAIETPVEAYAFCFSGRCGGYAQKTVPGIRTTTSWTYIDLGGDQPYTERTTEMVRFADESDAVCEFCQGPREISEQERPVYPNVSNQDPEGIFKFQGKTEQQLLEMRQAAEVDAVKRDHELADMRREMAELKAMLAEKANKPGPKPKEG